jgi:hypothetical protein
MVPDEPEKRAANWLLRHSRFLMDEPAGLGYFGHWIGEFREADPEAFASLRGALHIALRSSDLAIRRSAIQALAVLGTSEDIPLVEPLTNDTEPTVAADAVACLSALRYRLMDWDERLESVVDRPSFVRFVHALAHEREQAAEIERREPARYMVDGALGWMNGDIPQYLGACAELLEADSIVRRLDLDQPSWRLFAEFLYHGKIIE